MSSECTDYFRTDVSITTLHGVLKRHVIIYNPPYNIKAILSKYRCDSGVCIKIDIEHSTRHVDLYQVGRPSVSTLVTTTAVYAFQTHRLRSPVPRESSIPRESPVPRESLVPRESPYRIQCPAGPQTGHSCSICMEPIFSENLLVLQCAHLFHTACIERWALETALSPSCPVCRTPLA